jgi:hypothetical protein
MATCMSDSFDNAVGRAELLSALAGKIPRWSCRLLGVF